MAIPMLKIRRPNGRLIFNMEIAIRRYDGLYIETGPWLQHGHKYTSWGQLMWLFLVGDMCTIHYDVTVRFATLKSSHTLHQNSQQNTQYYSWETDQDFIRCFDKMIFENTNYLQGLNCPTVNKPMFYLIFIIIILIHVCFLKHFKSWV